MKTIALLIELRHAFEKTLGLLTREAGVLYTTTDHAKRLTEITVSYRGKKFLISFQEVKK